MHSILPAAENPALRLRAREVPLADIAGARMQELITTMSALLAKEEHGVALAAPQVGEPLRLFIVSGKALARGSRSAPDEPVSLPGDPQITSRRLRSTDHELPTPPDQVYINPELLKLSRGRPLKHEGCLSIRGKWGEVPRAEKATIRAYDEHGVQFTRGASGFLAHIFQHEMDHLEGVLYIDKAKHLYDEKAK